MPLTAAQGRVLDFIAAYQAENGWAPSVREIGEGVGISSPSSVHKHLINLRRQGEIELGGGPRMIRLTNGRIDLQRPYLVERGVRR